MCQLLMLLFTACGKGRVLFSYVCYYPWMCVVGEFLIFPSSWIPSHVQYRARLGRIPEFPLCLAPCFGICFSFWAVSSHWFLVPSHAHLLSPDSDWNCFILSFYSAFVQWDASNGILGTRIIVSLAVNSKAGVCSTPRGWGGDGDCITLTTPCATKAQTSPWAVVPAGQGGARGSYSPLNLPGYICSLKNDSCWPRKCNRNGYVGYQVTAVPCKIMASSFLRDELSLPAPSDSVFCKHGVIVV